MELCLGTVQFGLDYGIRGQRKPSLEDAVSWIDYATQNGIYAIDTAKAYGTAEEVVGVFLKRKTIPREKLFLSTKLKPNLLDDHNPNEYERVIEEQICDQLKTLHTEYVDACMYHSARYAFDEEKLAAMIKIKEKGFARRVGVSVYEVDEARFCFDSRFVDFIQVPYSIFDHRMKEGGILDSTSQRDCIIDSRSAFLQGLIVMGEEDVPPFLKKARPIVSRIDSICKDYGISQVQLAMQYVKRETNISHLVFGVDSLNQLKDDICFFEKDISEELLQEIGEQFDGIEADIVMPSMWEK